jgi:hypothetical protein
MVELKIMKVVGNSLIGHNIELGDEVVVLQEGYCGDESVMVCWHSERGIIQLIHKNDLLFEDFEVWNENAILDSKKALFIAEDNGCQIYVVNTKEGKRIKKAEVKGCANENN